MILLKKTSISLQINTFSLNNTFHPYNATNLFLTNNEIPAESHKQTQTTMALERREESRDAASLSRGPRVSYPRSPLFALSDFAKKKKKVSKVTPPQTNIKK